MVKEARIFYYDSKKLKWLFAVNLLLLAFVGWLVYELYPNYVAGSVTAVSLAIFSTLVSAFVLFFPQNLAIVTDEGIKIDRCSMLHWNAINFAREIDVGMVSKRRIIVFDIKTDVCYPLTCMQRICKNSDFTAFSIPLYAMSEKDAEDMKRILSSFIKLQELKNTLD